MNPKQIMTDLAVLLLLPVLFLGFYFYFIRTGEVAEFLASEGGGGSSPGARAEEAVNTLSAIAFDASLFSHPVYLELRKFDVILTPAVPGREYPFTPSEELVELMRRRVTGLEAAETPATPATKTTTTGSVMIKR